VEVYKVEATISPLGGVDVPDPAPVRGPEETLALRPQVILVVDDEEDIRDSVKELLEASLPDVQVRTAEWGPSALKILRSETIDLIMTDYKMPAMNGLEFLAEARGVVANVPRILMTAFPDLELAIRAVNEEHIENFLTKPLDAPSVVDMVAAILKERRAEELRTRAFARSIDALKRSKERPT